jgi:hypothetical protein
LGLELGDAGLVVLRIGALLRQIRDLGLGGRLEREHLLGFEARPDLGVDDAVLDISLVRDAEGTPLACEAKAATTKTALVEGRDALDEHELRSGISHGIGPRRSEWLAGRPDSALP